MDYIKDNQILQSSATINGSSGQITLLRDSIVLNYHYHSCSVITKLLINEIINVTIDGNFCLKDRLIQPPKLITKSSEKNEKLFIYSVTPRSKRIHQLDILSTIVTFDSEENCTKWLSTVKEIISNDTTRPKSLTVFINPIGGLKKGVQLYNDKIKPIFELCGIKSSVTITQRRSEAEEYILNKKIDVDGFICVGGDGMLMELVQGLLLKARREHGFSDINHKVNSEEFPTGVRVGIIPAGSTDTVAYSASGTKDSITAALQVVLGKTIGIDAISVHSDKKFIKYNISLMGYGFYGNLVAESESLRWMGPRRYDWLGFKNFMSLEAFYGELSYLPVPKKYGSPNDGVYCHGKCSRCMEDLDCNQSDNQLMERVTVRDRFIAINSFLISCRCSKSPLGPAPFAHLGNGFTDLVIVRECSRMNFLQHLIRSASNEDRFDFDFVETVRVSEFSFVSMQDNKQSDLENSFTHNSVSPWNCDGEAVYQSNVHCKVHRQIIKLFSSGISPSPAISGPIRTILNKKEKK